MPGQQTKQKPPAMGGREVKRMKIQTGLRIPEERYTDLQELADEVGISLNALLLMLIDLGLSVRNGKFTVRQILELDH